MADVKERARRADRRAADSCMAAGIEYLRSTPHVVRDAVLALVSLELRDAWTAYEAAKETRKNEEEARRRILKEQVEARRLQEAIVQRPMLEAVCRAADALSLEDKILAAVGSERDDDRGDWGEEFPWEDPTIGLTSALVTFVKSERGSVGARELVIDLADALLSEMDAAKVSEALEEHP
jgi:hypothetical protein